MPKLVKSQPKRCHHKGSGQDYVKPPGKAPIYLGTHNSKEAKAEYDRIIAEWLVGGRCLPASSPDGGITVAELALPYVKFAMTYYDGENKGELHSIRLAIRVLQQLYGDTSVKDFGPIRLKAVREKMVALGWARRYVNVQIGRIRRMFRWGVEQEMVKPEILQALEAVAGLKKGKTTARETDRVKPVPEAHVDAILDHVPAQVKAMIELQQVTGMRPAETCIIRGCDLDTTGKLWTYKPAKHKTMNQDHEWTIYLGPRAQEIVKPFLKTDLQAYLFSPK